MAQGRLHLFFHVRLMPLSGGHRGALRRHQGMCDSQHQAIADVASHGAGTPRR